MSNTIRVVVNDIEAAPGPGEEVAPTTEVPVVPETGTLTSGDFANAKIICGVSAVLLSFAFGLTLAILSLRRRKYRKFEVDFDGEDVLIGRKFDRGLYATLIGLATVFTFFGAGSVFNAISKNAIADDDLAAVGSDIIIEINRDLSSETTIYSVMQSGGIAVDRATTNGYDLYAYAPNGINRLISDNEENNEYISPVSGDTSMNAWGLWLYGSDDIVALPASQEDALLIDSVSGATLAGRETTVGFNVVINLDLPAGTYEGAIEYLAVKKPSEEPVGDMTLQGWTGCASLGVGETVTLTDVRDGQTYKVSKLYMDSAHTEANARCWMMENLNLGASALVVASLDSSNTNTNTTISANTFNSWRDVDGTHSDPVFVPVNSENSSTGSDVDEYGNKYGVLYDFVAASAGTYSYGSGADLIFDDLCPKNWHIPLNSNNEGLDEFTQLFEAYGLTSSANSTTLQNTLKLPLAGYFDVSMSGSSQFATDQGMYGYYWSSVKESDSVSKYGHIGFNASGDMGIPESALDGGYSVRCLFGSTGGISPERTYTLTYDANGGSSAPEDQVGVSDSGFYDFTLSLNEPVWSGKTFLGWSEDGSDTEASYQPGEIFEASSTATTLYAIWQEGGTPAEPVVGDMTLQGWTGCASLGVGETVTLTDVRDGQTYKVSKLYMDSAHTEANARCWMMENLNLGASALVVASLDSSNTNTNTTISANTFNSWVKSAATSSFVDPVILLITASSSETGSAVDGHGNRYGSLYNYAAASAGTYTFGEDAGVSNAQYDLCPSGWRLPTGGTAGEYKQLITDGYSIASSTAGSITMQNTLGFPLAGLFFNTAPLTHQGAEGHYWSSTRAGNSTIYAADVYVSTVYVSRANNRSDGYSVRCIK